MPAGTKSATAVPAAPPDVRWREWLVVAGAVEACAVAVWLIPASVHIVSWLPGAPVRVALFASGRRLLLLSIVALLTGVALARACRRRWGSGGGPVEVTSAFAPLLLLWSWAIPFVPWLPDRAPVLLMLSGPTRWMIAIAAGLATTLRAIGRARVVAWLKMSARLRQSLTYRPTSQRSLVFAASLALYLICGLYNARTNGPRGDEPHYLIITESLLRDGDLAIENNHRRGDFRAFFSGELKPDYLRRGKDGQIYSVHAPGLPAVLLPIHAAAGYDGVVVAVCLMAALAALAMFDVAKDVAGADAAVWTWLAVCLTVPMVPQAWLIFPETPAALLVAWAVLWAARREPVTTRQWCLRGAALSALPWLHTKFVVLLPVTVLVLLARALKPVHQNRLSDVHWRRGAAFVAPIVASIVLWLLFFYGIYGVADPQAPYGRFARDNVAMRFVLHGIVGLLGDSKFGVLFYSPIYVVALSGAWLMLRDRSTRILATMLVLTTILFVVATARFYMFWGGTSPPARFLVPVIPCVAPMLAVAIGRLNGAGARAIRSLLLWISLAITAITLSTPQHEMLFSEPHGGSRLLAWLQAGSPLASLAPMFTEPNWMADLARLGICGIAGALAFVTAILTARLRGATVLRTAAAACAAFLLVIGLASARASKSVRELTVRRGAAALLSSLDEGVLRPFDYSLPGTPGPDRLQALTTVRLDVRRAEAQATAEGAAFPPGRYEAAVWFRGGEVVQNAHVVVAEGRSATIAATAGPLSNPTRLTFELPVAANRLAVRTPDRRLGATMTDASIVPISVAAASTRRDVPFWLVESIQDRTDAYVAYQDAYTYPEGGAFWTRGTRPARVQIVPGGASHATLTVSTGPRRGTVRITIADVLRTVTTEPNDSRSVTFTLPSSLALVPLTVQSDGTFWPADHDRSSTDMRALGCHVAIKLD